MARSRGIPVAVSALVCAGVLASCEGRETRTVAEVKSEYAARFVEGFDFGLAGRIKAESFDAESYLLRNVRIDDGPERLYHAGFAEMHVSTAEDTIVLEFIGITAADARMGGLVERPVAMTAPVRLPFDVLP